MLSVLLAVLTGACNGAATVGEMVSVLSNTARVNGQDAAAGDGIPSAATVTTDGQGVARFQVTTVSMTCHMFQDASVQVPDDDPVLRFMEGKTLCTVTGQADQEVQIETERFNLTFDDARFGVDLSAEDPIVFVNEGEMLLETFSGAEKKPGESVMLAVGNSTSPKQKGDVGDQPRLVPLLSDTAASIGQDGEVTVVAAKMTTADNQALQWLVREETKLEMPSNPTPTDSTPSEPRHSDGSPTPDRPSVSPTTGGQPATGGSEGADESAEVGDGAEDQADPELPPTEG